MKKLELSSDQKKTRDLFEILLKSSDWLPSQRHNGISFNYVMKSCLMLLFSAAATLNPLYAENQKNAENIPSGVLLDTSKINIKGVVKPGKVSFSQNEEMTFVLSVDLGGQTYSIPYYFNWTRVGDDGKMDKGSAEIAPDKTVIIKTSMNKPGFVYIKGVLVDHGGNTILSGKQVQGKTVLAPIAFHGGAGVDIDKLVQAVPEPVDFDAYWNHQKKILNAVPIKYKMDKVSKEGSKLEVFAVKVDCAGTRPVTGYLTIPAAAKEKSLPIVVHYQGYGINVQKPPSGGPSQEISFSVNAHGYDLGKDTAYYDEFFKNIKSSNMTPSHGVLFYYAWDPIQNANPETAYFNGMVLRVMCSLQFVKSLPQWDGRQLTVQGTSQGGLQTIWAAGLDHDVTCALPGFIWCCDFSGANVGRIKGWQPEWVPALGYFDAVNHAKRVKCPVNITGAGLGDYTCPPSGLAILYNVLKVPKKIHYSQCVHVGVLPENAQTIDLAEE